LDRAGGSVDPGGKLQFGACLPGFVICEQILQTRFANLGENA
jgi:hypothetical protein